MSWRFSGPSISSWENATDEAGSPQPAGRPAEFRGACGAGPGNRRISHSLPAQTERFLDVIARFPGAVRLHLAAGRRVDRCPAGTAADQYLRVGQLLPDVSRAQGGEVSPAGLPDP